MKLYFLTKHLRQNRSIKKVRFCLPYLVVWFLFSGCASNSVFMDACPLEEGQQSYALGVSYRGTIKDTSGIPEFTNVDLSFIPVDILGVASVDERMCMYLKYTTPITISFGGKLSFSELQDGKVFYNALGLSIGVDLISFLSEADDETLYFDVRLPVYHTFCISQYFSLSAIPSLWIRKDYRKFQFLAGGNCTVKLGNTFGMFIDGSVYYNTRYKEPEFQLGLALFIKRTKR